MVLIFVILLSISVSAQNFRSEVESYLTKHLIGYDKIEFSFLSNVSTNNYKIDESRELKVKNGTAYLPVKYSVKNKSINSIISLQLKLYKLVPVAVKEIKRKEKIDVNSYILRSIDVASLNYYKNAIADELNSVRAKSMIKEGQIITKDLIEEIPAIQYGSRITAECVKGSVVLSTEAIARQDGRVNDIIDILTSSNELLKAKVINSQKVLIE